MNILKTLNCIILKWEFYGIRIISQSKNKFNKRKKTSRKILLYKPKTVFSGKNAWTWLESKCLEKVLKRQFLGLIQPHKSKYVVTRSGNLYFKKYIYVFETSALNESDATNPECKTFGRNFFCPISKNFGTLKKTLPYKISRAPRKRNSFSSRI